MLKPRGSALKAYENGREARKKGVTVGDNPNKYGPNQVLASWWEKGWTDKNIRRKYESKNNLQEKP